MSGLLLAALAGGCRKAPPRASAAAPEMRGEGWDGYATQERCPAPGVHVELHMLAGALRIWMTEDERAALEAIDLTGTRGGDARIQWSLADGVVRTLLPLQLDALDRHAEATQLRDLRPLQDPASADAALAALGRISDGTADDATLPDLDVMSQLDRLSDPDITWRGGGDDEHCYELGEAHSTLSAAAEAAIESGAPRKAVVSASLELVKRTVHAARTAP